MQKRSFYSIAVIALMLVTVAALTFGSVRPVQAADIRNTGVLNADETVDDDLIISGRAVRVDGTVNGLLVAAGQTVTLNGTINGDAVLVGETIIVSDRAVIKGNLYSGARTVVVDGTVEGSIAAGSASMVTGATVGRNIYYGGYSLETRTGNDVARGLYFGGYQAVLRGSIARDLQAAAGALELYGTVGGNATLQVGSPDQYRYNYQFGNNLPPSILPGLRIASGAKIGGKLVYTSEANQAGAIQVQPAGGIVYQTPAPDQRAERRSTQPVGFQTAWSPLGFFRNFVTLLLLGLLAVWLMPKIAGRVSEVARTQFGMSAVYGLVTIVVGYLAAFTAAVLMLGIGLFFTILTLGGLSNAVFGIGFSGLGLAVAAFTLVIGYLSKLVIAYLLGNLILSGANPNMQGRQYLAMTVGVLIYAIARSIPFLGWIIGIIVTIAGVGAIWLYWRSLRRPAAPVVSA